MQSTTLNNKRSSDSTCNLMERSSSSSSPLSDTSSNARLPSSTKKELRFAPTTTKKEVRFAPKARVRTFKRAMGYDSRSSWYSTKDVKRIQMNRASDISMLRGRDISELEEHECFWGLENSIVPGMRPKILLIRSVIRKGVLDEQRLQRSNCTSNPDKISRASSTYSEWSATVAHKKALFYSNCIQSSQEKNDLRMGGSTLSMHNAKQKQMVQDSSNGISLQEVQHELLHIAPPLIG